jgi:hypothetical protein
MRRVAIAVAGGGTNIIGLYKALRVLRRRLAVAGVTIVAEVGSSAGGLAVLADAFDADEDRAESQIEGASTSPAMIAAPMTPRVGTPTRLRE